MRPSTVRLAPAVLLTALIAAAAGCQSGPSTPPPQRPAAVTPLNTDGHADRADQDRLALARFIGAWNFQGWYNPPGEPQRQAQGIAAATVDHRYFILLDSARAVAQGETGELIAGSMLLSVEPGNGLMLTAWSDQSPAVRRFRGRVEANGSYFIFDEVQTVSGNDRARMVMRFETDNRWVAEFHRIPSPDPAAQPVASYTFTRAE